MKVSYSNQGITIHYYLFIIARRYTHNLLFLPMSLYCILRSDSLNCASLVKKIKFLFCNVRTSLFYLNGTKFELEALLFNFWARSSSNCWLFLMND